VSQNERPSAAQGERRRAEVLSCLCFTAELRRVGVLCRGGRGIGGGDGGFGFGGGGGGGGGGGRGGGGVSGARV